MTQFVVVGAGPAGCSAALKAARIPDVRVKVIEKRSFESVFSSRNSPRSYPMVLSGRALGLFDDLDLDLPSTREPYYGIEFLPSKGSLKFPNPDRCALVSRSQLALNLLYEAARHPSISIYFGVSPVNIDVSKKTISLEQTSRHIDDSRMVLEHLLQHSSLHTDADSQLEYVHHGHATAELSIEEDSTDASSTASTEYSEDAEAPEKLMSTTRMAGMQTAIALQARQGAEGALQANLAYDFLIGADGACSKVKQILSSQGLITEDEVMNRSTDGYKTFTDIQIPQEAKKRDAEEFPFVADSVKSCQKLWFIVPQKESKLEMRIVLWRNDSDHVCGMVPGVSQKEVDEKLTPETMRQHFGNSLPEWFLQPFCDQLNASAANSWGAIRSVNQFHAPHVVLLGDSAHAVTSALGQGCNMALESVRVFGKVLEDCVASEPSVSEALAKVPGRFTDIREKDARAMQRMELLHTVLQGLNTGKEVDAFTAMHARVAWGSTFMLGVLQWKLMPNKFSTVPLYEKLYDENVPYSDVLAYVNRVGAVAYGVLGVALSVASVNIWQLLTSP